MTERLTCKYECLVPVPVPAQHAFTFMTCFELFGLAGPSGPFQQLQQDVFVKGFILYPYTLNPKCNHFMTGNTAILTGMDSKIFIQIEGKSFCLCPAASTAKRAAWCQV